MGGGGGPPHPFFSRRNTPENTRKTGFSRDKTTKKSPALVRIGYDQRTRARFAASCVLTVWPWWTWWRTNKPEQSSIPTDKQKRHKENRIFLRFPCALWQTFSVGTLCPLSIAYQNRNVKYTMQRSPVWLLCTRQEPKSCTSTACTLWACLTSPRVYDRVIFIQTPPCHSGRGWF